MVRKAQQVQRSSEVATQTANSSCHCCVGYHQNCGEVVQDAENGVFVASGFNHNLEYVKTKNHYCFVPQRCGHVINNAIQKIVQMRQHDLDKYSSTEIAAGFSLHRE